MRTRSLFFLAAALVVACDRPKSVSAEIQRALQVRAGSYPLLEVQRFGRDSAYIVLEDSALTSDALAGDTWMFGPQVSAAEAGSCPPEKVLGQRIARELWWRLDSAARPSQVVVFVKSAHRDQRIAEIGMFYYLEQLQERWIGDTLGRR